MSRILFWLALVFLVIFAIRSKIRNAQKRHQEQFRQPPPPGEVPPRAAYHHLVSNHRRVSRAQCPSGASLILG